MFTDGPVTPTRLETLINLMREFSRREITREILFDLLQPETLPNVDPKKRDGAEQTLAAARDLGLLIEDTEKRLKLTFESTDKHSSRQIILNALDEKVLANEDVEPYFARFYSYLLGLNSEGIKNRTRVEWVSRFERDAFAGNFPPNPFNADKVSGLNRWFSFTGLGWYDTSGVFQPNPYERLLRRLPLIFGKEKKVTGEVFMQRLTQYCPELDGGEIFRMANRSYNSEVKICTLGLSHALIDLHQEKKIRLVCPRDSRGWSIELAEPPSGDGLDSSRIDSIEFLKN